MGGVFADDDLKELEIFRHFLCGHDLGQIRISRRKASFIYEALDGTFS